MNPARGGWLILFTLLCAMVLAILHLPETLPDWLGWLRRGLRWCCSTG